MHPLARRHVLDPPAEVAAGETDDGQSFVVDQRGRLFVRGRENRERLRGPSRAQHTFGEAHGGARHARGRFDDHRTARDDGGRDLVCGDQNRAVERGDAEHGSERPSLHQSDRAAPPRDRVDIDGLIQADARQSSRQREHFDRPIDLKLHVAQCEIAGFVGHRACQILARGTQRRGDAIEDLRPVEAAHRLERALTRERAGHRRLNRGGVERNPLAQNEPLDDAGRRHPAFLLAAA